MTSPFVHPRLFSTLTNFYPDTADIQQRTDTRDAVGQPIPAWATVSGLGAVACRVSPTGGGERKQANQIYTLSTHVINLAGNYIQITTKMRAVVSGVTYDILLVEHDGNGGMSKLVCQVVK